MGATWRLVGDAEWFLDGRYRVHTGSLEAEYWGRCLQYSLWAELGRKQGTMGLGLDLEGFVKFPELPFDASAKDGSGRSRVQREVLS